MPGDLHDHGAVDDDFAVSDAQRQGLANEPQRYRVVVLLVSDATLNVGDPVDDSSRVVSMGRQGDEVWLLLGVAVDGTLLRLAMDVKTP